MALGGDPSRDRKTLRTEETVGQLCERYLIESQGKKSHRHDIGNIRLHIRPRWDKERVRAITRDDLRSLKRAMSSTPIAFNRVQSLISAMWKFGEYEIELIPKYKETSRQRYLSDAERERLKIALDEYAPRFPHYVALIRLLYLTGARLSEIMNAKRSDYSGGQLVLRDHKTSEHEGSRIIMFPAEAQAIIEALPNRKGSLVGVSSYPNTVWGLIRKHAELDDFRLHDLRHSFASDALAEGVTLGAIGEVLGHKDLSTTKRYAHLSTQGKLAVTEIVASRRASRSE